MSETVPVWQLGDRELLAELRTKQQQMNLLYAETLALIAEVDHRCLAAQQGYGTTAALVRDAQNLTKAQARHRVAAAQDLVAGTSPSGADIPHRLPCTAEALRIGQVNEAQVAVIQDVLAAIPPHAQQHRPDVERRLAAQTQVLDAGQLRILGRQELAFLDQDGKPPVDDQPEPPRTFTMRDTSSGRVQGAFDLDPAGGAALKAALSPLTAPRPATEHGEPDTRTLDQRQADALVELAERALDRGELPTENGERPHLTVTLHYDVLHQAIRAAQLDGVGPISPETARRYACDSGVIPIVLGSASELLDIGRRNYPVTTAIRRALNHRDRGCAHPGCPIPPQYCDAHHVKSWLDGGVTALPNLVLLCKRHHRLIHHSEWTVRIINGRPAFYPPPWVGTEPLHNTLHSPATQFSGTVTPNGIAQPAAPPERAQRTTRDSAHRTPHAS